MYNITRRIRNKITFSVDTRENRSHWNIGNYYKTFRHEFSATHDLETVYEPLLYVR